MAATKDPSCSGPLGLGAKRPVYGALAEVDGLDKMGELSVGNKMIETRGNQL